jgi:hypothetical protein
MFFSDTATGCDDAVPLGVDAVAGVEAAAGVDADLEFP